MNALRNRLLLLVVATGLALGVLPAAPSASAAPLSARLPAQAVAERTVTLELSRDSVKVGRTVDATGTVTHAPSGTPVQVQRGFGGTWVTVGITQTTSAGAFAVWNLATPQTGAFLYRALVAGSGSTGPVSSDYAWLVVTAKHPPTIVSGFVQAGGPLAGSTVRIYLPHRAKPVLTTRTTHYGYFLARLPSLPRSLRVEASGGRGPAGKFRGTMIGITPNPNTRDSSYVNPASTLVATYLDTHPKSTRAAADKKVRDLLGLKAYHNLESALGGRPSYFDGVKFLQTAKRNGGFDAYVASLVEQIDEKAAKVTFRSAASPAVLTRATPPSSAVAGLIGEDAAGALGVAAQGASVINATLGLMNLVGSLVGWSPSGGPTPAQMLSAIDQVQRTLNTMIGLINGLSAEVQDGLTVTEQDAYNNATAALGTAYGNVNSTQLAYQQYVNDQFIIAACTTPPLPGTTTPQVPDGDCTTTDAQGNAETIDQQTVSAAVSNVGSHLKTYLNFVGELQPSLGTGAPSRDVFRDALLAGSGGTPGLTFLVDLTLDQNDQLFVPASSTLVQNYAATVLTSQAWAYYLVMGYLRSTASQTFITAISNTYLGGGGASAWPTPPTSPDVPPAMPTSAPPTGNLHDEMTYLQSILPVPEWMAVDTNSGGLMYMSTSNVGLATYLPTAAASRALCYMVYGFNTAYRSYPTPFPGGNAPYGSADSSICTTLGDPLNSLNADMLTFAEDQGSEWAGQATDGEPPGTYSADLGTGWSLVSQGDLGAILPRLAGIPGGVDAQYYFNPGPVWFPGSGDAYTVDDTDRVCYELGYKCGGYGHPTAYVDPVIDWMKLYFKTLSGADAICTWAVGQANGNSDPCFDMPALVSRPLQPGEVYVP
jgi:hypothetical protein